MTARRPWRPRHAPVLGLLILLACLTLPGNADGSLPADPADQPPFGGGEAFRLQKPLSETGPPPGFSLDPARVAAIAGDAVEGNLVDEGVAPGGGRVRTRVGA